MKNGGEQKVKEKKNNKSFSSSILCNDKEMKFCTEMNYQKPFFRIVDFSAKTLVFFCFLLYLQYFVILLHLNLLV